MPKDRVNNRQFQKSYQQQDRYQYPRDYDEPKTAGKRNNHYNQDYDNYDDAPPQRNNKSKQFVLGDPILGDEQPKRSKVIVLGKTTVEEIVGNHGKSKQDREQKAYDSPEDEEQDYEEEYDDGEGEGEGDDDDAEQEYDEEYEEGEGDGEEYSIQDTQNDEDVEDEKYNSDEEYDDDEVYDSQNDDQQDQYEGKEYENTKQNKQEQPIAEDPKNGSVTKKLLSDASFRMLTFELRKNDQSLPKNCAQRTVRDELGFRASPPRKDIVVQQQPREVIKQPIVIPPPKLDAPIQYVKSQYTLQCSFNNQQISQSGFYFTDDMSTDEDQQNARTLRQYNDIFEVDSNYQFKASSLIKPYLRSNQGKTTEIIRSFLGIEKSMNRIIDIILNRNLIKQGGEYVNYFDIFDYVHDRYRAIRADLIKMGSNYNVSESRVMVLEQMTRFYLLSYFEMIREDQTSARVKDNKIQCKKQINKLLANIIADYLTIFHKCKSLNKQQFQNAQYLNNIPEFVQYQYLNFYQSLKPYGESPTYDQICELDFGLCNECPFFDQLVSTKQLGIAKFAQNCIVINNFTGLSKLFEQGLDFFQALYIIIIIEAKEQLISELSNHPFQNPRYQPKQPFNMVQEQTELIQLIQSKYLGTPESLGIILTKQGQFLNLLLDIPCEETEQIEHRIIEHISQRSPSQDSRDTPLFMPEPVVQPQLQTNERLSQLVQKWVTRSIVNLMRPIVNQVDFKVGQYFYMKRLLYHWRLVFLQERRRKQYNENTLQNLPKSSTIGLYPIKTQQQQQDYSFNFNGELATMLSRYHKQIISYYKIVIICPEQCQIICDKLIFSFIGPVAQSQDNYQINIKYKVGLEQREVKQSILCLYDLQTEMNIAKLCGADLIVQVVAEKGMELQNSDKHIQFINVYDSEIHNKTQLANLSKNYNLKLENLRIVKYKNIESFDTYFGSLSFRRKMMCLIKSSTQSKPIIPELKEIPISSMLKNILLSYQTYVKCDTSIKTLITICDFAEMCLQQTYHAHDKLNIQDLPQELLFNQFINLNEIYSCVLKINPAQNLMLPILQSIKQSKQYTTSSDILAVIKNYLIEYSLANLSQYQTLIQKHFRFNKKMYVYGDWGGLVHTIFTQIIQQLNNNLCLIVPCNFQIEIDKIKLDERIQKDMDQFENKDIMSEIYNFELLNWIQKKVNK